MAKNSSKPKKRFLGKVRRSTIALTNGPGAVVDFREANGAPISAVVCGLDQWDCGPDTQAVNCLQPISEPRLQHTLNLEDGLLLPPVVVEGQWSEQSTDEEQPSLKAARFPLWLQCPKCGKIAPENFWEEDAGELYRYCRECTTERASRRKKMFVIPVRFIMACENGHLDDFPWHEWVGHTDDCRNQGFLQLTQKGAGLAGYVLSCPKCKASRSLGGIFGSEVMARYPCRGLRPWLTGDRQECDKHPRVLQRGASNLYFPIVRSALSIPPWSDDIQKALGQEWIDLASVDPPSDLEGYIRSIWNGRHLRRLRTEFPTITPEQLAEIVRQRTRQLESVQLDNLRPEEYDQFTRGVDIRNRDDRNFEARIVEVPPALQPYFSHIVRVVRLREVRAITGFTRIRPPGDDILAENSQISTRRPTWLPAIEVRGEGIFLALDTHHLETWERLPAVQTESQKARQHTPGKDTGRQRQQYEIEFTPRFMLVHSLAHALMRQLTLECGYSSAALRERLYVDIGDPESGRRSMAGLLIYTSTSDSDGTLGGLERQGSAERIERTVIAGIEAMEWCSSDPLCIKGIVAAPESHSPAACHACLLAPETACEKFNHHLHRGMLVGTPENPDVGFFTSLLRGP